MFRGWIRDWLLIDLLALGIGAGSTLLYVLYADRLPAAYGSYKDIWSNLGTEILGVWISVRIIDSLIGAREERGRVRDSVVGNLNFMMKICQDIPPHFDSWRINDIGNELTWFNEKRTAPAGSRQIAKFFTSDERAGIDKVIDRVEVVDSLAKEVQPIRADFNRLADSDFRWKGPDEIGALFKATERFNRGDSKDDAEVSHWLAEVKRNLDGGTYSADMVQNVNASMSHVTQLAALAGRVREAIAEVEVSLAALRRSIAASG